MSNSEYSLGYVFRCVTTCAAGQLIALSLTCCAQEALKPGIFGVTVQDKLTHDTKIIGAAFLIDRQQGYAVTAAHVLKQLGLKKNDDPIKLQINARLPDGASGKNYSLEMRGTVVACKYDYVGGLPLQDRQSDWALLKIDDKDGNRFALDFFRPITIDPDGTDADLTSQKVSVFGFPSGVALQRDGNLNLDADQDGTWLGSLDAQPGNSGGPCILAKPSPLVLLGIVIEQGTGGPNNRVIANSVRVLPPYQFLDEMARLAPDSERVRLIIDCLKTNDPANPSQTIRNLIRSFIALSQMTGLEHIQLQQKLKDAAIPGSPIVQLISSFGRQFRKPSFAHAMMQSRPDIIPLMQQQAGATVKAIKVADRHVSANELEWSLAVEDFVVDAYRDKKPNRLDRKIVSNAATNYVYLFEQRYKPAAVDEKSLQNLRLAADLDPKNPDLRASVGIAAKYLDTDTRLYLTASKVNKRVISTSPESTTLEIQLSGDRPAYSLWQGVLRPEIAVESVDHGVFEYKTNQAFVARLNQPSSKISTEQLKSWIKTNDTATSP